MALNRFNSWLDQLPQELNQFDPWLKCFFHELIRFNSTQLATGNIDSNQVMAQTGIHTIRFNSWFNSESYPFLVASIIRFVRMRIICVNVGDSRRNTHPGLSTTYSEPSVLSSVSSALCQPELGTQSIFLSSRKAKAEDRGGPKPHVRWRRTQVC